jgi:hypothetical protein
MVEKVAEFVTCIGCGDLVYREEAEVVGEVEGFVATSILYKCKYCLEEREEEE